VRPEVLSKLQQFHRSHSRGREFSKYTVARPRRQRPPRAPVRVRAGRGGLRLLHSYR
jgi:hypothetical protein